MMRQVTSLIMVAAVCVAVHAGGIKFDITSDHEDATYKLGEQAVFTVKVLDASGAPAKSGRVKWNLNNFGAKVFASGTEDLSANGGTFTVKGAQTEPGFLRLDVTEVGKNPSAAKWGVAFEPKKIVPGTRSSRRRSCPARRIRTTSWTSGVRRSRSTTARSPSPSA